MSGDDTLALFEYDQSANRQILGALRKTPDVDDRAPAVLAHLLAAQRIWIERLSQGGRSETPVWPALSLAECEDWIGVNEKLARAYLAGKTEAELATPVRYWNTRGAAFENTARDVLHHVLLHGAYHRGQIAAAIREGGGTPPLTDYINHVREPL